MAVPGGRQRRLTAALLQLRMILMLGKWTAAVALVIAAALPLSACGSSSPPPSGTTGTAPGGESRSSGDQPGLTVVTGFYPLQYVTQRLLGPRGTVVNLTPPGAEPHDLELTPKDVAQITDSSLVIRLSGFQPAVDDAADGLPADAVLDVAPSARLDLKAEDEDGHTGIDPHFWLDPTRLADVADAVAARLASVDPQGAATFTANATALRADLTALDAELRAGLGTCTSRTLVTSHEAFGYLAQRYDLRQLGIAGLSPDAEPDAGTLARITDFVKANKVTTIYHEPLVSPAVAETVARGTGAASALLDPLEGLADASSDYFGVMRSNLGTLRTGQGCS